MKAGTFYNAITIQDDFDFVLDWEPDYEQTGPFLSEDKCLYFILGNYWFRLK